MFPDSTKKISENGIIKMLKFLSDTIFALFGTRKLLKQGVKVVTLKSSLRTLSGRHHDLIKRYGLSVSQMIIYVRLSYSESGTFLIHDQ